MTNKMNVLEAISKRHSYRGKFKPDSIPVLYCDYSNEYDKIAVYICC